MIRSIATAVSAGILLISGAISPASAQLALGASYTGTRLILQEGVLDFSVTPFPVAYTFSVDDIQIDNASGAVSDSLSVTQRSASASVTGGVIKVGATSAGLTPGKYVHGAVGSAGFADTFTVSASDPTIDWVPIKVRFYVDGEIRSTGGVNTFGRGGVQSVFDLVTAPGGQQGGSLTTAYTGVDPSVPTATQVDPCVVTASEQSCGLWTVVSSNQDTDLSHMFTYDAVVKADEQFTLQILLAAGAYSLGASEWTTSDFLSTGIFGGIEVADGLEIGSLARGGVLQMVNGIANYDTAFAALTGKYGSATPGIAAIPEPASWTMLIAGFCMLGAAARRRGETAPAGCRAA